MEKTPTTITAAVWNYCNNSCDYCVSKSNEPRWTFNGNFEIFKPAGFESANDYELRLRFGADYYKELCPDKKRFLNAADLLPFDELAQWVQKFKPGAVIHLSGGEPLLRPDIETETAKLSQNFPVVILTNGQLLHKRPGLYDLPVKWLVSYHREFANLEKFRRNIEPLKNKPHLITMVVANYADCKAIEETRRALDGFNFDLKFNRTPQRNTDFEYRAPDLAHVASNTLNLITPNGAVYPCNSCKYGSIGCIYRMEYDEPKAHMVDFDAAKCVKGNNCSAYQTAVIMNNL